MEVALNNDFNLGIKWSISGNKGDTYYNYGDPDNKLTWADSMGVKVKEVPLPLGADRGGTGVNLPANIIYGAFCPSL